MTNGAQLLVQTLLKSGIDVCFGNPGTSEMHFVAALDSIDGMRCILKLFEGGVTGAADGYYRMSGRPAATLLHLGPGFANGWANLHNGRKAHTGVINIVGDHASHHAQYDAPLTADIDGVIRSVSQITRRTTPQTLVADTQAIITAAQAGQTATLILPADTAWQSVSTENTAIPDPVAPVRTLPSLADLDAAAQLLTQPGAAIMLGNRALHAEALTIAGQIAHKTGCHLFADFFNARMARGRGRVQPIHLTYSTAINQTLLQDVRHLLLVGAGQPVAFFGYPGQPSLPTPAACHIVPFAAPTADLLGALTQLAHHIGATDPAPIPVYAAPTLPTGETLSAATISQAVAALLPENSIVVDEAIALWQHLNPATVAAAPHDWLAITGGAIGHALPCAVGAAVAAPGRPILALEGDGSAMYTIQSLWTMAREKLDVTVVILSNRGYQVLFSELKKMGIDTPGPTATRLLEMSDPAIDWGGIAAGFGVPFGRATTLPAFIDLLQQGFATPTPLLIEAVI